MKGGILFTEPLPSNDRRDTHTRRLMGGIYEVPHSDGLRCHDIHTKFHENWLRLSKLIRVDPHTHKESMEIA
jgi:hypothetical protein